MGANHRSWKEWKDQFCRHVHELVQAELSEAAPCPQAAAVVAEAEPCVAGYQGWLQVVVKQCNVSSALVMARAPVLRPVERLQPLIGDAVHADADAGAANAGSIQVSSAAAEVPIQGQLQPLPLREY